MSALTIEQLEFLASRGLSGREIAEYAALPSFKQGDPTGAERTARYRARLDVSPAEWDVLRYRVFERDSFTCTYCGSAGPLCADHVVPLVQGGLSTLENLTTACMACNSAKSGRTPEEWQAHGA